jgi:hypothetical protein
MDSSMIHKYSNIFWHQGVKPLQDINGKINEHRIQHLENDVTKALFNIFEHCSKTVLESFLKLIGVKGNPTSFSYKFQVENNLKFFDHPQRIMLSIVADSANLRSGIEKKYTRPDGAIYNDSTVILIESKTQSALDSKQIESHIRYYLGTATERKTITWEELSELFNNLDKRVSAFDKFLISQFTSFLGIIGISEFKNFRADDFKQLYLIGKIPREEYLDIKRIMNQKIRKFMKKIDIQLKDDLSKYYYSLRISKVSAESSGEWSAFYFYDDREFQ